MMNMVQWLSDNKAWLFDGVGVLVLGGIGTLIYRMLRPQSRGGRTHTQHAETGPGSSIVQAGGDVVMNPAPERHQPTLRVLAHRAHFIENPTEDFYFIKVINTTPGSDVEVTHVWYEEGQQVELIDHQLPARLLPNETWETFVQVTRIPVDPDVFKHFHAELSTGERFASEHNVGVRPAGRVARR